MLEIGTSGLMSGDGKRGVAAWPKLPRPSSTLPIRVGRARGRRDRPNRLASLAFRSDATRPGTEYRFIVL
jgi:hypothetical protein